MASDDQTGEGHQDIVDITVRRLSRALAQRTSRRSLLGWIGRAMLSTVGARAVYPNLPWDRRQPESPDVSCSTWYYCGLEGHPCASCSGAAIRNARPGANPTTPSGLTAALTRIPSATCRSITSTAAVATAHLPALCGVTTE